METTNEVEVPVHYNPSQLVTYKVIDGGNVTFPTTKVTDLEWTLENARSNYKQYLTLRGHVNTLEESLAGWIENANDAETIVAEICQLFEFNPTKEFEFEALVRVTGTVSIPLSEVSSFDINDLDLDVDVNSYAYDIDVSADVEEINEM